MSRHLLALSLLIAAPVAAQSAPRIDSAPGYVAYVSGRATDVATTPQGGVLLAGGGTDSDDGMRWLLAQGGTHASGQFGDVVVLRASGADGYNQFLLDRGANSVTSIVITSVAGASSNFVRRAIERAEVLFIAGGDQSRYVKLWTGTALQAAVNARVAAGYPIGGTSAGLAVLGPYVYAAYNVSSVSRTVLAQPYDSSVTLTRALFAVPGLDNVITDSHFVARDRMGRLLTFLARLQQDFGVAAPRAIAVDERSAITVTRTGQATVVGAGRGAYLVQVAGDVDRVCRNTDPPTPLTLSAARVLHVPVGQAFDVPSWTTSAGSPYTLRVDRGVLTSSTHSVY